MSEKHETIDECYEAGNVQTHWDEASGFEVLKVPYSCECGKQWEEHFTHSQTVEQ